VILLVFSQPFSKSARHLGSVLTAAYRPIGTFPIRPFSIGPLAVGAFPIAIAVLVSISVSISILGARRGGGMRTTRTGQEGFGERIGPRPSAVIPIPPCLARPGACAGQVRLLAGRLVSGVVLRLHIRHVEEAVAADREVHEGGLDRRLQIDNLSFVDVPGITLVARSLDIQFLEDAVLDDRDPAFLGLQHIDQHLFFHAVSFQNEQVFARVQCVYRGSGQARFALGRAGSAVARSPTTATREAKIASPGPSEGDPIPASAGTRHRLNRRTTPIGFE
jgi:hypothetical protein